MAECESTAGKWGEICPDCGQRLPPKPAPLASWKGMRGVNKALSEQASKYAPASSFMNRSLQKGDDL